MFTGIGVMESSLVLTSFVGYTHSAEDGFDILESDSLRVFFCSTEMLLAYDLRLDSHL